jgi:MFS family permease
MGKNNEIKSKKSTIIKDFIIDGIGFFIDCYDMFMVPYFAYYINAVYYSSQMPYIYDSLIRTAHPMGALFLRLMIQLFPKLNNPIPNIGLIVIMASSLGISLTGSGTGVSFVGALIFWRFLMGIGLALENPFIAIINLPSASTSTTPKVVMKPIYLSLAGAIIAGYVVTLAFSAGFKDISNSQADLLDYAWRICEGSIFVPAAIVLYFRLTRNVEAVKEEKEKCIEEVLPETCLSRTNTLTSDNPPPNFTWSDSIAHFSKLKNFVVLVGGMITHFTVNTIFWGYAWNLGTIFFSVGFINSNMEIGAQNYYVALGVSWVAFGGIPGFLISTILIEYTGRKWLTLIGFGGMTIINLTLGFGFNSVKDVSPYLFIFLMMCQNAFVQLAPNGTSFAQFKPTMFAPDSEPSPNGYYATMISLGLIASQFLFTFVKNIGGPSASVGYIFKIYSLLSIISLFITIVLPNPQPFEKSKK